MTGNQVAAASVRIQKDQADEQARHNAAVEAEQNRSNKEQENIQHFRNALEETRVQMENTYNTKRNEIQQEYNQRYLALQEAQGNERLAIENALKEIESRKQRVEEDYKYGQLGLQQQQQDLNEMIARENARANKASEQLKSWSIVNDAWSNQLQEKRIEYENSYWTASIAARNYEAQITHWRDVMNNDIALRNQQLGLYQLQLDLQRYKLDSSIKNKQLQLNAMDVIQNSYNNIARSIWSGLGLFQLRGGLK